MWAELICGVIIYRFVKRFFYADDGGGVVNSSSNHFNALFAVAKRLEKLYYGSRVYGGLQIPDPDSGSRQNIDLVLVTNQEAVVISVVNVSGSVSVDEDGSWVCTDAKSRKRESISNPVIKTKNLVSVLEEYLEQRGVALPEGYLSFKVICPNPNFRSFHPDSFPSEVITYEKWSHLKPEGNFLSFGWIKDALLGGKKKTQESFCEQISSVLSTAPCLDRLELKDNKCVLGEFMEFKGRQDDLQVLRKIRRSKVSRLTTSQKTGMFGFAHSSIQLMYAQRDYRAEGTSRSSQWEEVTVRSNAEVVFHPQGVAKPRKYKLSSVVALSLSA